MVKFLNSYKKLLKNSIVFALGNVGSKLILIALVPLYTYRLTTSEYGLMDIITTTINMLLPIISLSIYDAVLRFIMDKNYSNDAVITNALMITILGTIISLIIIYPIAKHLYVLDGLLEYMFIILIMQAFQSVLSQFTRAIGKVRIYSLNGILLTIIIAIMNIVLLVNFNMGINGYLLSIIIADLLSIIFLTYSTKIYKYIIIKKIDKNLTMKMVTYSLPLMPNALMWWTMNASSRYFILFFVGASANGLYAVANKIPSLLSILNSIFFQAWQLSAIEEYDSQDKSKFYSKVFNYLAIIMFIGTSAILLVLKYVIKIVISPEFYSSWEYVPFLLLGVVFSSFSSFLGTNYIAAKQTKGVFKTSVIGGAVSILTNVIFIPLFGTSGASISTMVSFFVIWILRLYDTKQFINMNIDVKLIGINLVIILCQISILYININSIIEFISEFILFVLLNVINRSLFNSVKHIILVKYKARRSQ